MNHQDIYNFNLRDRLNIENSQNENFLELIKFYKDNSTFARELLNKHNIKELHDLQKIGFMDSYFLEKISCSNVFFTRESDKMSGIVLRSGGTIGKRKTIFHSWDSFRTTISLGARGIKDKNSKNNFKERNIKKIANCLHGGNLWGGFLFAQGVSELLDVQLFPFSTSTPIKELANLIFEHRIDTLIGLPSFIHSFLNDKELDLKIFSNLKNCLYIGENFHYKWKEEIKTRYPNIAIKSLAYSTNETGPIGYQCPYQDGGVHHIHEDSLLVELIDPITEENIHEFNRVGEVVVTVLTKSIVPLLRYKLGDLAVWKSESCLCGDKTKVIDILGRKDYSVKVLGSFFSINIIKDALESICVLENQDIQLHCRIGCDFIQIEVLVNSSKIDREYEKHATSLLLKEEIILNILSRKKRSSIVVLSKKYDDFNIDKRTGKRAFFIKEII